MANEYESPPTPPPKDVVNVVPERTDLTPLRAHYLKRELVNLQFLAELSQFSSPDALGLLGPPFKSSREDKDATDDERESSDNNQLPFLHFIFNYFALTFPFLARTQPSFFSDKLQPFVHSFMARNISTSDEREEETKRRKISSRIEKSLSLVLSSAIKLADNDGKEEIIRLEAPTTNAIPNPGIVTSPRSQSRKTPTSRSTDHLFDVNVVTIRNVVNRGRVRSKAHEYFVIRTRRTGFDDVYVSRRYGDFVQLAEQVRHLYIFL